MNTTTRYTRAEAQRLVGRCFRNTVPFSGVPQGTRGKVVGIDEMDGGYDVIIEWQLGERTKPLRDWFTRDEMERFMEEE